MPQNQTTIPGIFNLTISVPPVFGVFLYIFTLDGSSVNVENNPTTKFEQLNSGQQYMISVIAVKNSGDRNFTSQALVINATTSKNL